MAPHLSSTTLFPPALQVSSTETGVIFGNIVYEGTGYAERSVIVLNDIHIDIMDYISPASCADVQVCMGGRGGGEGGGGSSAQPHARLWEGGEGGRGRSYTVMVQKIKIMIQLDLPPSGPFRS